MSNENREINRRLLDPEFTGSLDPPKVPEPEAKSPILLARQIVARSKRRVMILTWLTCLAWILATAAGCALSALYFVGLQQNVPFIQYRFARTLEKIELQQEGSRQIPYDARDYLNEEEYQDFRGLSQLLDEANQMMMILSQVTVLLTGFAALMSVWLITASRRCTMKQINANLASICQELKVINSA